MQRRRLLKLGLASAAALAVADGAINSPAVLLRSGASDPHGRLGSRTFLHPVVMSSSIFDQKVEAWSGAPQSVYTDHFLQVQSVNGAMGCKLEAPPGYPLIFPSTVPGLGRGQHGLLSSFAHNHTLLALPMKLRLLKIVSAHVMRGCGLAGSARQGLTRPDGRHWQLGNLSAYDGSIFPTSIGANPQLSVYGAVNRLAQGLARALTGREVALA
jgi:hypothetical protein